MAELLYVKAQDIDAAWAQGAEFFVAKAIAKNHGECTVQDAYVRVSTGQWNLWVAEEAGHIVGAVTCRIVEYPQYYACEVIHFATSLPREEWLPLLTGPLEEWARTAGCTHIMLFGRKGFERFQPAEGYTQWYTCMGKTLAT